MYLVINELIEWLGPEDQNRVDRILWVDEGNIIAYVIDIHDSKAFPRRQRIKDLINSLEIGEAVISNKDPWARLIFEQEIEIRDKGLRDAAWTLISSLVTNEPDIYLKKERGKLIQELLKKYGGSHNTVYKYLRKYWQRGMNKDALLPDYDQCGNRGQLKTVGEKKKGRPRIYDHPLGADINVDEETRGIFKKVINRYYLNRKQNTFSTVYNLMIRDFYANTDQSLIPTKDQFRYWYRKGRNYEKEIRARKGDSKYESDYRGVTGSSNSDANGPGSLYQIDATVADIYLVSRFNRRWIIGKPVLYIVVDVFSRMIVGLYIGLEGPSWIGAMMALANALGDKVKFCKDYQIDIAPDEWPCKNAPSAILADRGELLGKNAETMIEFMKVKVKNTPPYRPDWKGVVEQKFRLVNEKVKPVAPGFVLTDMKERGGPDYRLDAKLTIFEFTQMVIQLIRHYNRLNWLDDYELDEAMIEDEVKPIPRLLWEWGMKNRSGKLRFFGEKIVKFNLIPRDKARVTLNGINFKNICYSCTTAIKENWFALARKETWELDISYDPRNMTNIYIRQKDKKEKDKKEAPGNKFEVCFLVKDHEKYKEKSLAEVEYLMQYQRLRKKINEDQSILGEADLLAEMEKIATEAKDKTDAAADDSESKTRKVQGIQERRKIEKELNRQDEAFVLEETKPRKSVVVNFEERQPKSAGLAYNRRVELLKRKAGKEQDDDNET